MKRFYAVLLLFSISFTALAQTTNKDFELKLLRVFEWVLDARFSNAERAELSRLVDISLRSNNPAELKSLEDVAKLNNLIDSIPADREAEARTAIQEKILEQLRKTPDDPTAKLLLSVYNKAHLPNTAEGSHVSGSVDRRDETVRTVRPTAVPAELVGEWIARRGSGSSYYNPNSGSYGAPNGTTDSYKFFADGRYEHAILMQNSLYNCTIRVFGYETGKTSIDGNTLTITPGPGTLEYTDNCRPNMNSKKATQMEQKKWQWQVSRDELGVKLCARDETGASACYYRQ